MSASLVVGLPVFNEAANLDALLRTLTSEPGLTAVFAVDDHSTDDSLALLQAWHDRDPRVQALQNPERSGQLAAWLLAARTATSPVIVFVDADAIPQRGAIELLVRAIEHDSAVVASSGRVVPDAISGRWPPARFRAAILHRVRALGRPKEALIGRFFAVRREWFLATVRRSDIIANDAYLGACAARERRSVRYVPAAVCRYVEASSAFDFAAQRQRADAGYAQLVELGLLQPGDGPAPWQVGGALIAQAVRDPLGAFAWLRTQIRARGLRAYRVSGRDAGSWDVQATTKRSLE